MGLLCFSTALRADDWTTTDGKVYRSIKVVSYNDGFVTVIDSDGGAQIPLRLLNPDLQTQFHYDPAKAAACETAAEEQEKADLEQQRVAAASKPMFIVVADGFSPLNTAPPYKTAQAAPAPVPSPGASPKPVVDVQGNNAKIEADQQELDNVNVDIGLAQKEIAEDSASNNYDMHSDAAGVLHPNHVGGTPPAQRLTELQKKQADLEAEIATLKQQNASADSP